MSEVMICRGCSGGDEKKKVFKREIIEDSMIWTVPDIINNEVYVRLFGAGGSNYVKYTNGYEYFGNGGSGWLNNGIIKLTKGGSVAITVGKNGGESTSFGSLLIANAGSGNDGGSSSGHGTAYQFGGGFESDGGVWGGGGGFSGRGGLYGGGGGAYWSSDIGCLGGKYGGNGGNRTVHAENGTNTIGWTNVDKDISTGEYITGPGLAGYWGNNINNRCECGGGGFGGCGGILLAGKGPTGGGGYGGNAASVVYSTDVGWGTSGGGYGKGADGMNLSEGGAGYFTPSEGSNGAGWGKYGYGSGYKNIISESEYHNAGPGVCVIEYYVWEDSKSK